jgi:hypothetical protein
MLAEKVLSDLGELRLITGKEVTIRPVTLDGNARGGHWESGKRAA